MQLQRRKNGFGKFQVQLRFHKIIVLDSSSKFRNLKPCTNIPSIRFDLDFCQTLKRINRNYKMGINILESSNVCFAFREKWICICQPNYAFLSLLLIFNHSESSIQALDSLQKTFMGNSNIGRSFLESFKVSLAFPPKWFCIR